MNALVPPPLPPWEGLHPLVVHFPIALLLVAPIFVVLGMLPRAGKDFSLAALVLLVLGTIGAYVAVATGEVAAGLAVRTPLVSEVLERHEKLAETARTVFTIITVGYAIVVLGPLILPKKVPVAATLIAKAVCLIAIFAGGLVLANAGHEGARLVHDLGVHAWLSPPGAYTPEHE